MTRVGILGAGQLCRMLALAGYPLGLHVRAFDPTEHSCCDGLLDRHRGDYGDRVALERFVRDLDVVTYEFENVPADCITTLEQHVPVYPPRAALHTAQERLREKRFFAGLDIPTAPFAAVDSRADLDAAVAEIGLPAVLKTRRFGYDGKGQALLKTPADLDAAWTDLGTVPLILEGFVSFDRELSVVAARSRSGESAVYPLVENHHRDGILRRTLAPAPGISPALANAAEDYARRVLEALDYVGVLAIELFQQGETLLANEMAPRVHNSGHWSIDGAVTSQFENHLRAILGLPLGDTRPVGHSVMVNLIGGRPDRSALLAVPGLHLHDYDKAPRPGRKIGHVTVCGTERWQVNAALEQVGQLISEHEA